MKKKLKTLKICALLAFLIFNNHLVFSQVVDMGKVMLGGANDANKILGAYVDPFAKAFGYNLSAGWYNTAKLHSLLGFDFTVTLNVAMIPSDQKTYDVSKLGLSTPNVSTPSIAQTIAGSTATGPEIRYMTRINNTDYQLAKYNAPGGIGLGFVPMPMIQLDLGLVKGTEIIGRFLPTIGFGKGNNTEIGMWGVGLKHSIKQYIPAVDDIPFLNLSILAGYSQLHMVNAISLNPNVRGDSIMFQDILRITFDAPAKALIGKSKQQMDLLASSFTANAIVSLDFPIITIYAGVGISTANAELKLLGNYAIPKNFNVAQTQVDVSVNDIVKDPVKISIKGGTKPRVNIGFKLKLGFVGLHFDYTNAKYSIATAGLGISFR
jgi:hypothetical protein